MIGGKFSTNGDVLIDLEGLAPPELQRFVTMAKSIPVSIDFRFGGGVSVAVSEFNLTAYMRWVIEQEVVK